MDCSIHVAQSNMGARPIKVRLSFSKVAAQREILIQQPQGSRGMIRRKKSCLALQIQRFVPGSRKLAEESCLGFLVPRGILPPTVSPHDTTSLLAACRKAANDGGVGRGRSTPNLQNWRSLRSGGRGPALARLGPT